MRERAAALGTAIRAEDGVANAAERFGRFAWTRRYWLSHQEW